MALRFGSLTHCSPHGFGTVGKHKCQDIGLHVIHKTVWESTISRLWDLCVRARSRDFGTVWERTTLGPLMVLSILARESAARSKCFGGSRSQNIGTSHGLEHPGTFASAERSQCFGGSGDQNIGTSHCFEHPGTFASAERSQCFEGLGIQNHGRSQQNQ